MSKPSVLLADDHPSLLAWEKNLLQRTYEVVGCVRDGQALVEAAMKLEPDVIVTDIFMPILNGMEAVRRLKESGCKSKVVFLTVHADPDYNWACLSMGAQGYVVKIRMAKDLLPAIQAALAGQVFVSRVMKKANALIERDSYHKTQ
jgi:two-component system response regulator NreC